MKLRQILRESNYGSLIDQDKYNEMDSADQVLYKYTADGFSNLNSSQFRELERRYPYAGGTLYRGLYFSEKEDLEAFLEKISDGTITTNGQSSWSPDRATAKEFAQTTKTYFPSLDIMKADRARADAGDHMPGEGGGVLLKIAHAEANVGIDVNKTSYSKESEVLLPPGTYEVSIEQTLRPFRISHSTIDKAREMLDAIAHFNVTGEGDKKDLQKYATYLEKSFLSKLDEDEVDELIKFQHAKALSLTPEKFAELSVGIDTERGGWKGEGQKELNAWVNAHYDYDLFSHASVEMQDRIMDQLERLPAELAKHLKTVEDDIENYKDFYIKGFDGYAQFDPEGMDVATRGLKRALSNYYHKLNSREYSRSLTSMDQIRDHSKVIASVVKAMASLS